jgi:hypothetical protein
MGKHTVSKLHIEAGRPKAHAFDVHTHAQLPEHVERRTYMANPMRFKAKYY